MADPVQARWLPLYPVDIPGQGVIEPGALAWIGWHEANASDNWAPLKPAATTDKPGDDKVKT